MMNSLARTDTSRSGQDCFFAKGIGCTRTTDPYVESSYSHDDNLVECSDFLYNSKGIVVG